LAKKRRTRNLSRDLIKIRILQYLFLQGREGRNAHDIQLHCVPTSQEATRFKGFLDELCELGRIERKDQSNIHKGQITYNITDRGADTIRKILSEGDFFGLPEEET
jgi:hypothetical protein